MLRIFPLNLWFFFTAISSYPHSHHLFPKPMPVHVTTPLVYSPLLSKKAECNIYLKLENGQPSGSFKSRGLGHISEKAFRNGKSHLVCSSGGNAGLAAAYSALVLGAKCTVCIPTSTPLSVRNRLVSLGANAIIFGENWNAADTEARRLHAEDPHSEYIPPFDHPLIVEGNASIGEEMQQQWSEMGHADPPDAVICSVGGGGLLSGVLTSFNNSPWQNVNVLGVETFGASSLHASLESTFSKNPPETTLATIPSINTIATTLGARTVAKHTVDNIVKHNKGVVKNALVHDSRAVDAILQFSDDHQILVEPACSVSLTFAYESKMLREALPGSFKTYSTTTEDTAIVNNMVANRLEKAPPEGSRNIPNVVIIVCGGSGISIDAIDNWKVQFNEELSKGNFGEYQIHTR